MKKFLVTPLLFVAAAAAFVGCDDNEYVYYEIPDIRVIDFEGANLGTDGFIWGKDQATEQDDTDYYGKPIKSNLYYGPVYTEKEAQIYTYFTDYGHTYDVWNGIVISNRTDKKTEGYENDKSVYADGGANGSAQFAALFYSSATAEGRGIPTVKFVGGVKPVSVDVANMTYLYLYFKGSSPAALVDVKAVITGYNSGRKTGEVTVTLVDKASETVKSGWETVDLSALGTVTSLTFATSTTDDNCPDYFAIDNLTYEK